MRLWETCFFIFFYMHIYKCLIKNEVIGKIHLNEVLRRELIELNAFIDLDEVLRRDPIVARNAFIVGEAG